jgi:glycosyltransferase involved in cell wall biosynthesis
VIKILAHIDNNIKISIITPSYNKASFIRETINSVLSQEGYFYIEYIVIDNRSDDETISILQEYEELLNQNILPLKCLGINFKWISEADSGLYNAINRGFSLATGDVYAWINADDIYMPGAFALVAQAFFQYPYVRWLKGITSYIDAESQPISSGRCYIYNQAWLQVGIYGREAYFVQQDSVFWRAELWQQCGPIHDYIRLAGDYWLWIQFSHVTPLYSINRNVSSFRKTPGQLSEDFDFYIEECSKITCESKGMEQFKWKLFFYIIRRFPACAGSMLNRLFGVSLTHQYIDAADPLNLVMRTTKGYLVEGV